MAEQHAHTPISAKMYLDKEKAAGLPEPIELVASR